MMAAMARQLPSPATSLVPVEGGRRAVQALRLRHVRNRAGGEVGGGKVQGLKAAYLDKVVPLLKEEFSLHEVPKIEKIVFNIGIGDAAQNSKRLEAVIMIWL